MAKLDIIISTKCRHGELGVLLTSLLHQTFTDWDLLIVDDSETSITSCDFLIKLINLIKLKNHRLRIERAGVSNENCKGRQQAADMGFSPYILRVDDDVFFAENNNLQRLVDKMDEGFDMVGGITPNVGHPEWKRDTKFVKPFIDEITFDKEGNVSITDNCGFSYLQDECINAHHLRSSFMYKRAIHDAGVRFEMPGRVAFREESMFCLSSAWKGFNKFCVLTGVKFHHFRTPSGGCRLSPNEYQTAVMYGDKFFKDWCKRNFMKLGNPFLEDKRVHELVRGKCSRCEMGMWFVKKDFDKYLKDDAFCPKCSGLLEELYGDECFLEEPIKSNKSLVCPLMKSVCIKDECLFWVKNSCSCVGSLK